MSSKWIGGKSPPTLWVQYLWKGGGSFGQKSCHHHPQASRLLVWMSRWWMYSIPSYGLWGLSPLLPSAGMRQKFPTSWAWLCADKTFLVGTRFLQGFISSLKYNWQQEVSLFEGYKVILLHTSTSWITSKIKPAHIANSSPYCFEKTWEHNAGSLTTISVLYMTCKNLLSVELT